MSAPDRRGEALPRQGQAHPSSVVLTVDPPSGNAVVRASGQRSFAEYLSAVCEGAELRRGVPLPLGAHEFEGGVNFALFSRDATRVRLELFARPEDGVPERVVELDPVRNRTGDVWHVWVQGIPAGQLYGYRLDGPYDPRRGLRFNFRKLLLDPYATAIASPQPSDAAAALGEDPGKAHHESRASSLDDAAVMPKCVFTREQFDWRNDAPPRHSWSRTVLYETHVRGFTIDPSSGVEHRGSYRGLSEKIPYLRELGVTAVLLMPVQEFNPHAARAHDPATGAALGNYWGYDPIAFFAPYGGYSSAGSRGQQTLEFKEMVCELHAAGIEVIIDIVLGHTAEGDERGPTLCWRGIDNPIFYSLQDDRRHYLDDTGAGNTINASHPVVRDLILDALRHWVLDLHVDGFRLDLGGILGRDSQGRLLANPRLLEQIAEDPILRDTKLIAMDWDAAGADRVGSLAQRRWGLWNSRYRDDVRRFWRGDAGMLGAFASRLCGSQDLLAGCAPGASINFVTSHDGFTLNDLVSYAVKHNLPNGAGGRDGTDANYSCNYGVEGPTEDPLVAATRARQVRNFLFTLFVSRGVPMLLGGDEFRRTQLGNNNAYCQDNATSWYDWSLAAAHPDLLAFARGMSGLRRACPILSREEFYDPAQVSWLASDLRPVAWSDARARSLGCLVREAATGVYLLFNADTAAVACIMPALPAAGMSWRVVIDTAWTDCVCAGPRLAAGAVYRLGARSCALLIMESAAAEAQQPVTATGAWNPAMHGCSEAMGGDDPACAYAAAMLWSQGYP